VLRRDRTTDSSTIAARATAVQECVGSDWCAMNVPWCGWGEGWQALQVFDYKAPRASDNCGPQKLSHAQEGARSIRDAIRRGSDWHDCIGFPVAMARTGLLVVATRGRRIGNTRTDAMCGRPAL